MKKRAKRDRIIIVCNGSETEKNYLDFFKRSIEKKKNGVLTIEIVPMGRHSEPSNVVHRALELKNTMDPSTINSVWSVIDIDDFVDVSLAQQMADKNHIHLVYSNRSIEFWFLCHFIETTKSLTQKQLIHELKKYVHDYDKTHCYGEAFYPQCKKAINNAKIGHQSFCKNKVPIHQACSSTSIYRLIEYLLERFK